MQSNFCLHNNEHPDQDHNKRRNLLQKKLCECTKTNVAEVLLLTIKLASKHSLTLVALRDIFQMLNSIFNIDFLPTTTFMINKLMDVDTKCLSYHLVCLECNAYLGKETKFKHTVKCSCGAVLKSSKTGSFFIEIDIKDQLRKILSNEVITDSLKERFHRTKTNINAFEDVYDGEIYKEFSANNDLSLNQYNFSYTLNTDGCKAADHSKVTIWPVYLMLHELPDHLRKKNMILVGLWVAKEEPPMNIFLDPFVHQANELSTAGFQWYHNDQQVTSKLFLLGCCVDSVARCAMLNMKQYNGYYGCTYCEHPGKLVNGVIKYPMQKDIPAIRTDYSIKQQMLQAHEKGVGDVQGVWGPTSLMNLQHFDLARGMILDFMHSCLLGVTESYTKMLLENSTEKYYIGSPNHLHIIDKRLSSIQPPSCIAKVPRSIRERNYWKASEWLSWLLFYCLICFEGILKKKYYNHLALFVAAMNDLLESSITPSMLERARTLLVKFVFKYEKLYGEQYMFYNVHLLLHLTENVKNWGPLWVISTFPFENENKLLLQKKKCNYRIAQQIVNKLLLYQQVPLLYNGKCISPRIQEFFDANLNNKRLQKVTKIEDCTLLGLGKKYRLKENEIMCLREIFDVTKLRECYRYMKFIYKGCRYSSCSYVKSKRNNDSIIVTNYSVFGLIRNICKIKYVDTDIVIIFMNVLNVRDECFNAKVNHLKIVNGQLSDFTFIRCNDISRPSLLMHCGDQFYCSTIAEGAMGKKSN